jgi:hypothetical protein
VVAAVVCLGAANAQAIVGGQFAGAQYGAVGEVVIQPGNGDPMSDECSGFLISPTAFVTAGHCALEALGKQEQLGGTIGAAFEPTFDPAQSTLRPASAVVVHPEFLANQHSYKTPDVAVLRLSTPVTGVSPIGLPTVGVADQLTNGTLLTAVGYGFTRNCGTALGHCQVDYQPARRYASETLNSVSQWFVTVNQNPNARDQGGICQGDSGGPQFLPGTTTAIAITTAWFSRACWSISRDIRLDTPTVRDFLTRFAPSP